MPDLGGNKKIIFIILGVVGFLLILALIASVFLLKKVSPTTVTVWGLWEDNNIISEVISDYQRKNPSVTIKYVKQSPSNYRDRVKTEISGSSGPDIFWIHNSWLPMFKSNLVPMPTDVYSPAAFKTTFYPVATQDFISSGKAYGVPLEFDSLAMYVNQDILAAGGVVAPTTWDGPNGFLAIAEKLTVRDPNNKIRTAGTALGTASNVDHWQDILALMMLQAGVDLNTNPGSAKAQGALSFYTAFASSEHIWDETLDSSTLAFASGKVGMYFGPSWRFFDIKALNPSLNFKVVPVPQLSGADTVNYATYWGAVVSNKSKNSKVAWDFLKFLTSKEELTKFYTAASKTRPFGQPYPRPDMASLLSSDPNVGEFIKAGPTAKSWYLDSFTNDGDTGINSRMAKYYRDAVNSVLRGGDSAAALQTVTSGVNQVLGEFGTK